MRFLFLPLALSGCTHFAAHSAVDGRDDQAFSAEERVTLDDCTVRSLLEFINSPATDVYRLNEAGVHTQAAKNIVKTRNGNDKVAGTADDVRFLTLAQLDEVPYVGPVAMEQLAGHGESMCEGSSPSQEECAEEATLRFLNDPSTDVDTLKANGVHTRAANSLIETRNGADMLPGTADDLLFHSLGEIDDVPQVGPAAIESLLAIGSAECIASDVIFSPQAYDESHLALVKQRIEEAEFSIDVAMYSFSDTSILNSLADARERGVSIRFLYEGASEHRKNPANTRSAQLEDLGIEVRWINKIMHHKFAIIDGPRTHVDAATTGRLLTGSGNWSYSAGTRYDENMIETQGDAKLMLAFQKEFNHLWNNSRDVIWNEEISAVPTLEVSEAMIDEAEGSEALFTSANFRTYESSTFGPTFTRDGDGSEVAEALVELILNARSSIRIASGHLRSRMIAEAIIEKHDRAPEVDIKVYLDGQEYVSQWYSDSEAAEYELCLNNAETASDKQECDEKGYYFGYALHQAGVPVRYKYYAYRWDYTYAEQMHHKYIIVDNQIVASGSYNFSNNAEHNTMENMVFLDHVRYPNLVDRFTDNFDEIWNTGHDENRYASLMLEIETAEDSFPIVFDSMALNWDDVTTLKALIQLHCPDINSEEYREDPSAHRYCER